MATDAYPVQVLHRQATGGQWHNLGAAYAAVRFLRPQDRSLVLSAGTDGGAQHRIVFAYPILPGDAFERMDGETLSWADPECGDEFALCSAVSGAISPVTKSLAALDGLAERLVGAGLRVAREEGTSTGGD